MDLLEALAEMEIVEQQNAVPTPILNPDTNPDTESKVMQTIINSRVNYAKWVALVELYKVICNSGGMIFGGATRDYIKRTTAANKFYKYFIKQDFHTETYKKHYNDEKCDCDTYEDRILLPNDIDVYITESNYNKLIQKLEKEYYIFNSNSKKQVCYFLETNPLFRDALEYKQCYIYFLKALGNKLINILLGEDLKQHLNIKIDFVILKDSYKEHREAVDGGLLYPPFGNPDFDVNQLGMIIVDNNIEIKVFQSLLKFEFNTYYGTNTINPIEIMEIKSRVLKEVFKNIENSIAVPVFPNVNQIRKVFGEDYQPHINFQRAEKMADKDYCINGEKTIVKFKHIKYQPLDYICNEDEKCIICMDIFTEKHKWLTFGCVCNVKMHLYCYAKYIRNPTIDARDNILCPHCRTPNQHQCPCTLLNFISSLNHWVRVCDSDKECKKCIQNNFNDQCLKWYYQCRVCVS